MCPTRTIEPNKEDHMPADEYVEERKTMARLYIEEVYGKGHLDLVDEMVDV